MLDTTLTPIHDDSPFCTGTCWGFEMDVTGLPLLQEFIRAHALEVMKPCKRYSARELGQLIVERHKAKGGTHDSDRVQVSRALRSLEEVNSPSQGFYERLPGEVSRQDEEADIRSAEANAEVKIGDGEETIYGWYFPTYRRLADLEGKQHFRIKVGRSGTCQRF